jgi:hypothetical protein
MESTTFTSEIAKQNAEKFRRESQERLQRSFRQMGVCDMGDIERQIEENLRKSKTCKKCGLFMRDYYKLELHRNSQLCKKRQSEQKGETFVTKAQTPKFCEICNRSVLTYNWSKHLQAKCHLENVRILNEPAFECTVCDRVFNKGQRPKQMLKKHLCSKKHQKKLLIPGNRYKHNAILRKHNFTDSCKETTPLPPGESTSRVQVL